MTQTKRAAYARISLIMMLLIASALTLAPAASAHTCKHHDPRQCDAGACEEGENHEHTDHNDDTEDHYCKSQADPYRCKFVGQYIPEPACTLLRDGPL